MAFREWFGLTPAAAAVLCALHDAGGEFCSLEDLGRATRGRPSSVRCHVADLREALDAEAVDCMAGRGYALTDAGFAECRQAIRSIGEEFRTYAEALQVSA